MSYGHAMSMPAMGGNFPGHREVIDAEVLDGEHSTPMQRPPSQPQPGGYHGGGNHGGTNRRFRLPQTQSEWITALLWVAGPGIMVWGLLPAVFAWQIWQADYVRILIGGAVWWAQFENHKYFARIPAKPKTILVGMAMLAAVGLTSPEMYAPVGDSISGMVERAISGTPAEPAPPPVQADPAEPQQ